MIDIFYLIFDIDLIFFIFPKIDDISIIEFQSVEYILSQAVIDRREKYIFNDDIVQKYNLN